MNPRIRELALKAQQYADQQWLEAGYPSWETYYEAFAEDYNKKFAELIIRECTNMLPTDSIRNEEGVHMFYVIRDHFGVSPFEGVR